MDQFKYYNPVKIIYGNGCFKDISSQIKQRKTLVITSNGAIKRGLIEVLKSQGLDIIQVVSNIPSHPTISQLEPIYLEIAKYPFEVILAVGGGSVLDSAKFLSVQNEKKEFQFVKERLKTPLTKENYKTVPIIGVPTTSGTSSEITPWATIWDQKAMKKFSLHLPELFCEAAFYDPELTLTAPKDLTIQTGLDTLSHAMESIWNKNHNKITLSYAIKSVRLIMEYLPQLSQSLFDLNLRGQIMQASIYAGLAFSNTQTALAHAMSYYITLHHKVPHGIACSFTLPHLMDNIIGKYPFIDQTFMEIFGELNSQKLRQLFKKLEVSTDFSDYGIKNQELASLKSSLDENVRTQNSIVFL